MSTSLSEKERIDQVAGEFNAINAGLSTDDGKGFIPCTEIEAKLDGVGEKLLVTLDGVLERPGQQCIMAEWELRPGRGSVNRDTVFDDTSEDGSNRHVYITSYGPLHFGEDRSFTVAACPEDALIVKLDIIPSESMPTCESPSTYTFSSIGN